MTKGKGTTQTILSQLKNFSVSIHDVSGRIVQSSTKLVKRQLHDKKVGLLLKYDMMSYPDEQLEAYFRVLSNLGVQVDFVFPERALACALSGEDCSNFSSQTLEKTVFMKGYEQASAWLRSHFDLIQDFSKNKISEDAGSKGFINKIKFGFAKSGFHSQRNYIEQSEYFSQYSAQFDQVMHGVNYVEIIVNIVQLALKFCAHLIMDLQSHTQLSEEELQSRIQLVITTSKGHYLIQQPLNLSNQQAEYIQVFAESLFSRFYQQTCDQFTEVALRNAVVSIKYDMLYFMVMCHEYDFVIGFDSASSLEKLSRQNIQTETAQYVRVKILKHGDIPGRQPAKKHDHMGTKIVERFDTTRVFLEFANVVFSHNFHNIFIAIKNSIDARTLDANFVDKIQQGLIERITSYKLYLWCANNTTHTEGFRLILDSIQSTSIGWDLHQVEELQEQRDLYDHEQTALHSLLEAIHLASASRVMLASYFASVIQEKHFTTREDKPHAVLRSGNSGCRM